MDRVSGEVDRVSEEMDIVSRFINPTQKQKYVVINIAYFGVACRRHVFTDQITQLLDEHCD